jgi:hypothetical protein
MKLLVTRFSPPLNKEVRFTVTSSPMGVGVLVSTLLDNVLITSVAIIIGEKDFCRWMTLWTRDILVSPDKITDEGRNFHPDLEFVCQELSGTKTQDELLKLFFEIDEERRADE